MPTPSPGLKRVPRWRTMISPPVTVWPAKTFTPRRCACESRPLRLEPRTFLLAILRSLLAGSGRIRGLLRGRLAREHLDVGDLEHGLLGAMAGAPLVAALRLELADPDLLAALMRPHDRLVLDLPEAIGVEDGVIRAEQQRLEGDLRSLVFSHAVDDELIALLDPVLLSAYSNDCVHRKRPSKGAGRV